MGQSAKPTRQNRTITVDFHDETTYSELLGNTKAFVEFVLAFLLLCEFATDVHLPIYDTNACIFERYRLTLMQVCSH
jgi:hypothetical protein